MNTDFIILKSICLIWTEAIKVTEKISLVASRGSTAISAWQSIIFNLLFYGSDSLSWVSSKISRCARIYRNWTFIGNMLPSVLPNCFLTVQDAVKQRMLRNTALREIVLFKKVCWCYKTGLKEVCCKIS